MTLRDMLLPGALLALCWGPLLASAQGPTPLQSLRCYNDYTSRIRCRWAESSGARRLLGLTLLRRLNADPPQPVSCKWSDDLSWTGAPCPGCVSRECEIPHTLFVLADYDYFSFRPNRPLGAKLDVTLAQHVQPPTPTDLQVSAGPDSFLLTWNVTQSPWLSSLEFEVAYRRLQDSWEPPSPQDTSTVYASSPRVVLARQLLPPGTYLARVRAQLAPGSRFSGQPSGWSAAVPWDSPAGDEAQPHNLQCLFDGAHALRCSWDVHAEVARALPFSLFYRPGPGAAEEECAPVWQEPRGSGYTRHRCEIRVPAPEPQSRYTVSVRPRGEEKLIKSSDNIQIARPALSVARAGDGYGLNWTAERLAYEHIGLTFQVQYKTEEAAWEDTEAESLQNARSMALPPLAPGTRYHARVRVKPTSNGYNGVWSEWSKESVWDTEWVLPTWGLVLILVLLTLASVPALRFCGVYGYRLNRKWEEKIPNPAKSLLFQNGGAGLRLPVSRRPPHQGPGPGLLSALQGVISGDLGRSEVSPLTTEEPGGARAAPAEPAPSPASPGTPQSPRPPGLHFNGPYLGLPHSRSLPNLGDLLAPPQPRPSGSLDYLCVPPAGQGRSGPPLGLGASPGDSRPPRSGRQCRGPGP
ncbi:cytokine receptor common subunit beta [Sorex araneus]|uniref:cytokine receptor common subunit beta n=1 Tax=Sorex araneus TaxID=42254 RepID=UPI002433AE17|nr:cytokine receptor common subunit beta [Sorex araneus]